MHPPPGSGLPANHERVVSTRLRRWYPVSCRHNARSRYFEDRTASFRALAPGVLGFHYLAFLRGGITACAFRAAIASWHLRVSYAPSIARQCMCTLRQRRRLEPPCLRAFHSPSPSALIPVLSTKRCNGPAEPRYPPLHINAVGGRLHQQSLPILIGYSTALNSLGILSLTDWGYRNINCYDKKGLVN